MTLSTDDLVDHLQRIHLGGYLPAAIFEPDLGTEVINTNGTLVVDAPKLTDQAALWNSPRAIVGLQDWIGDLKDLSSSDSEGVRYDEGTVFIDSGTDGTITLPTADPEQGFTGIDDPEDQDCEAVLDGDDMGAARLPRKDHVPLKKAEKRYDSKLLHGQCRNGHNGHTVLNVGPDMQADTSARSGSWKIMGLTGGPANFRLNLQHITAILKQCKAGKSSVTFTDDGQWLVIRSEPEAQVYTYGIKVLNS